MISRFFRRVPPARTVLMTVDTVGTWSMALELAGALAAEGVAVHLAAMGPLPSDAQRDQARRMHVIRLHESEFRLEWMEDPWADVRRAGEWLLRLEGALAPDFVVLHSFAFGALPWRVPAVVTAHTEVCSRWRALHAGPVPEGWHRYRDEIGAGLRGAALVTAPSRAMLDELEFEHGPLPRTRVVPFGRAAARFRVGRKEPRVLGVGRMRDAASNLVALDRIAPSLTWPVHIAGDHRQADSGTGRIRFAEPLGELDEFELRAQYERSAVFALPARYEPFGLPALDAALSGCALVLGDLPSLREVWGEAALYAAPNDDAALTAAIESLAQDATLCFEYARRAHERALEYSARRMALGMLDACTMAQSEHRPAAHDERSPESLAGDPTSR
jgi:glycogen synthase